MSFLLSMLAHAHTHNVPNVLCGCIDLVWLQVTCRVPTGYTLHPPLWSSGIRWLPRPPLYPNPSPTTAQFLSCFSNIKIISNRGTQHNTHLPAITPYHTHFARAYHITLHQSMIHVLTVRITFDTIYCTIHTCHLCNTSRFLNHHINILFHHSLHYHLNLGVTMNQSKNLLSEK